MKIDQFLVTKQKMAKASLNLLIVLMMIVLAGVHGSLKVGVYERLDPGRAGGMTFHETFLDSLEKYDDQAKLAADQGVKLLVFPEYGLTGIDMPETRKEIKQYLQVIPSLKVNPSQPWTPCLEPGHFLNGTVTRRMSSVARETGVTLVVNVGTIFPCRGMSTCPEDGDFHFNTNIVFNGNGTVVALYHKINLYFEPIFDIPPYSDGSDVGDTFTMKTSNNEQLTFGIVICFDLIWQHPTVNLVKQRGIKHIIYSTAWIDGLPFASAIQAQSGFSKGLNITLIAANLQRIPANRGGSGIYSGELGILNYTYGPINFTDGRLITTDIDHPINVEQIDNLVDDMGYDEILYDNLTDYTVLEIKTSSGSLNATNGHLTCNVQYEFENSESETETDIDGGYYLGAFQGVMNVGRIYHFNVETCVLFWCSNRQLPLTTCSRPPVIQAQSPLKRVVLQGNFTTSYLNPSTADYNLQPISSDKWTFTKTSTEEQSSKNGAVNGRLMTEEDSLYRPLVVAILGMKYDQDTPVAEFTFSNK